MIAVLGFIATDFMRLPGEMYSFDAIPRTIDAHDALLKSGPMYQVSLKENVHAVKTPPRPHTHT